MIAHFRTIAWLQFRLVKNSASRDLRWLGAFAWVLQLVMAAIGGLVLTGAAFGAGILAFNDDNTWLLLLVMNIALLLVLMVRMIMLQVELNEADFIDTGKLLFLPIRLRTLFAINLIVRNAGGLLLLTIPPIISLCLALAIMHGPRMLLGIPLGLMTLLAIAAWFDWFREWLLTLGKSGTKTMLILASVLFFAVIGTIGIGGVLAMIRAQGEVPIGVSQEKLAALEGELETEVPTGEITKHQVRDALIESNKWIPLGWFPLGLYRLVEHNYGTALLGTLGLAALAALGVALDYRFVLKRYRGAFKQASADLKSKPASKWTRLKLPLLDEGRSAFAGLTCATRARSFAVRSSFWFYAIAAAAGCIIPFVTDLSSTRDQWWAHITPFAAAASILFFSLALSNNIFGQDRTGFQALVLMPISRYTYILSKNAVTTFLVFIWVSMLMAPCIILFRPHPAAVAAALAMTIQAQLTLSTIGNGLSIALPFRLRDGLLEQPAQPLAAVLPGFLFMLSMPIAFSPMMVTALIGPVINRLWHSNGSLWSLAAATILLATTLCVYAATIPLTAYFLERRETHMLEVLASDRE